MRVFQLGQRPPFDSLDLGDFERYLPSQRPLTRQVDDAERAFAKHVEDLEVVDRIADHENAWRLIG